MAIAVDASSPVRWHGASASGSAITSASFTAPADALLVVCVSQDSNLNGTWTFAVSDSGGLAWTERVRRDPSESTTEAGSAIFTARTTSAVARTVAYNPTWTLSTASNRRKSCRLYVLTGVDVDGTPVDTV